MGELRFRLSEKNINIATVFEIMGFDPKEELTFEQFSQFITSISPNLSPK